MAWCCGGRNIVRLRRLWGRGDKRRVPDRCSAAVSSHGTTFPDIAFGDVTDDYA